MLTVHPTLLIGPSDWQPERMPKEEFARRIEALWQAHPAASRAIVHGDSAHHAELAYLTNLVPKLEPAVVLISRTGARRLFVGGGPNMLGASRPLTWISDIFPLKELGQAIAAPATAAADGRAEKSNTLLIGLGNMSTTLRNTIMEAIGGADATQDATPKLWALMRPKSSCGLAAIRESCAVLGAAMGAIGEAKRAGAGATSAVLAGERAANAGGAQDVRTLFSMNGGRTLQPFEALIDRTVDPLQVYVAVRRLNYWAEGFALLSERPTSAADKAAELLRLALTATKAGAVAAEVTALVAAAMPPYSCHLVTEGSLANSIGLALEEPPHTDLGATWPSAVIAREGGQSSNHRTSFDAWSCTLAGPVTGCPAFAGHDSAGTFEEGDVCSLKVGITDGAGEHAIVSAMAAVRGGGNELLWSGHG